MSKKIIGFHDADKEYGFMSNWYLSDFELDGIKFSSVEQYIMYSKAMLFDDPEHAREILATDKVEDIQNIGRLVKNYSDKIWAGSRQIIAYRGLMAKFSQNPDLADALLDTGNAILCECAGSDRIWGIGLKTNDERYLDMDQWRGQNLLGFALMQVRDQLTCEMQDTDLSFSTPLGNINVLFDGKAVSYDLEKIKVDEDEAVDEKYRITFHFEHDGGEHTLMCGLKANQPVTAYPEFTWQDFCYCFWDEKKETNLAIDSTVAVVDDSGEPDTSGEKPGTGCELTYQNEDGFYYQLYKMHPEAVANRFIFGIAWKCNCENEYVSDAHFASERALDGESVEMIRTFDGEDL